MWREVDGVFLFCGLVTLCLLGGSRGWRGSSIGDRESSSLPIFGTSRRPACGDANGVGCCAGMKSRLASPSPTGRAPMEDSLELAGPFVLIVSVRVDGLAFSVRIDSSENGKCDVEPGRKIPEDSASMAFMVLNFVLVLGVRMGAWLCVGRGAIYHGPGMLSARLPM